MKSTAAPIKLSILTLYLKKTADFRGFKRSLHEHFAV